jgi:hypothetical protein
VDELRERDVASRFADAVGREWWASNSTEAASSIGSAEWALDVYRWIGTAMEGRLAAWTSGSEGHPVDHAIWVIGEIADVHAMLAADWSDDERAGLPVPDRSLLDEVIRSNGLDQWAAEHGYPIEPGVGPLADTLGDLEPPHGEARRVVALRYTEIARHYAMSRPGFHGDRFGWFPLFS